MNLRTRLESFITSTWTEVGVACLILLSVGLVVIEAALEASARLYPEIVLLNDAITWIFVVELSIRFYVERRKARFFRRYWIDLIAVLPLLRAFRVLRVLRLLRLFRVGIILGRHLSVFRQSLRFIKLEYVIIVLAIVISVLMGALSMRFAEGGANASFATFERSLWFALMTMIGGEPIGGQPDSRLGRMITLTLMMGGLTVFAIFTGTVSAVMIDSLRNLKFRHMDIDELRNHVVICGWNRAAELIIQELQHTRRFDHVVIIAERELEHEPLVAASPHEIYVIRGDYTRVDVLREAGLERAAVAILLADDSREDRSFQDRDARTVLAAMLIEKLNPRIYTTVQLMNRDNETSLRQVGVEEIIVSDEYVGNIMASVVRNRGIVRMLDELLTAKWGHQFFKSELPAHLDGSTVAEAMVELKARHDATLLAVECPGEEPRMRVNPKADFVLQAGYRILVAASGPIDR